VTGIQPENECARISTRPPTDGTPSPAEGRPTGTSHAFEYFTEVSVENDAASSETGGIAFDATFGSRYHGMKSQLTE
jgi:hypothetical protein